jgi:2-polyprenyl-6-methoxyphenol hydroxylase-like FAD-dependent oxidoreductase
VVAGLLLARHGVDVLVLEKHADFLRDFRGDTIHPSTLELVAELGWLDEFLRLAHTTMSRVTIEVAGTPVTVADFRRLRVRCPYVAFLRQWDFLNFLAGKARAYPSFRLAMDAEATGLLTDGERVVGVQARTPGGLMDVRARLVLGADGRDSIVRRAAGLAVVGTAPPMDALWFRLPRRPDDRLPFSRADRGRFAVCIDRGGYWQLTYVIPAGQYEAIKQAGLASLRVEVAGVLPELADRVVQLESWADVRLLRVRVDRLRRWCRPGLLCIGDAAHAMSPAGGVGINRAVQDAVATATIVGPLLARGQVPTVRDRAGCGPAASFPPGSSSWSRSGLCAGSTRGR